MPYIGRAATNAGSVNYLDDISSGFDGSDTTFTCAISGTTITPGQENVYLYLDGVFQHPTDAYTISGSTITFTEAPASGVAFTGYVAGEGAYLDDGTVSTAKLDDDAVTASKLDDDGTGFQVGDLGVGGSLTSGDKLTVTGRLRASGGIIGDLTGDVTGNASGTAATVTGAAQSAITSVGTLTGLTIQGSNYTTASIQAGSTTHGAILNLGDSGDIDYGSITQFASSAGEGGRMRFIAGTTETMNLRGGKVGIGENVPLATLHVKEGDSGLSSLNGSGTNLFLEANGANAAGMTIASGNTANGFIIFGDSDSNFRGAIQYDHSAPDKMHLTTAGSQRLSIDQNGKVGVGLTDPASLLHVKTTANVSETIRIQNDDSLTTLGVSSDGYSFLTYQHSLYIASWDGSTWSTKHRIKDDGTVGIKTTNPGGDVEISGSNGAELRLSSQKTSIGGTDPLGTIQFRSHDSDNNGTLATISTIMARPNASHTTNITGENGEHTEMIFRLGDDTGSGIEQNMKETLRLRGDAGNWAAQIDAHGPYGLKIGTTASNSSSHDMFQITRGDGTACITTWGDGNTKVHNEIQTKAGLRTYATNGGNPAGDFYNVAHKFATYKQVLTSSHITDGYVTFSNSIYRDNVLGIIANYFGYASGTNNNYSGYNSAYITRTDYYASNVARAYLGSSATAGDFVYLTIIYHGNTG